MAEREQEDREVFDILLEQFKNNETRESCGVLAIDKSLIQVVSLWMTKSPTIVRPYSMGAAIPPPTGADKLWDWLWTWSVFDLEDLQRRSGFDRYKFYPKWEQLVGSRIVYPDGTVSEWAQRIINYEIVRAYPFLARDRQGGQ